MIQLGLARISRLVQGISFPWRAIHVAGTNGKGSVCSYASAMLTAGGVRCGRFTSPHLVDRWDCITINDRVVDQKVFRQVEDAVRSRDKTELIGASEFELLTATAFEIFSREKVQVAVVEVGLGGLHDATNILSNPFVTVITKIAMDHEAYLGGSLESIAYQKAGIMKADIPCFVDGSNDPVVISVLQKNAASVPCSSFTLVPQDLPTETQDSTSLILDNSGLEEHQRMNFALALEATKSAMDALEQPLETDIVKAALGITWPGRLQLIDISRVTANERPILLDGAHNLSSAEVLAQYVDRKFRKHEEPITWILAFSQGKDILKLISTLVQPGDNLIATDFGPVDGMPWVQPVSKAEVLETAVAFIRLDRALQSTQSLDDTLRLATKVAEGHQIVIAGSLYLVSDIIRLLKPDG